MPKLHLLLLVMLASPHSLAQVPAPVDAERLKSEAEREARSRSKEGCPELRAEAAKACVDTALRGLDVDCARYLIALEMGDKQAKGELFDAKGAGGPQVNERAANASCRVHLKHLRRAREKNDEKMFPAAAAPAACKELADVLQETCFPALVENGTMPKACHEGAKMYSRMGHSPSMKGEKGRETRCTVGLTTYKRLLSQGN